MARRNRVDPWGDLHAVSARGLFTGNRGCLIDDNGRLKRHHSGSRWIVCHLEFEDFKQPLDAPRTWTPLFFLDDAAALAAGHRPCGFCRRTEYRSFRDAVTIATGSDRSLLAAELDRRLNAERHLWGRGLNRADDRIRWTSDLEALPTGAVVMLPESDHPHLVTKDHLQAFAFDGWRRPDKRPRHVTVKVLTPPTAVAALRNGFVPQLHPSAGGLTTTRRASSADS